MFCSALIVALSISWTPLSLMMIRLWLIISLPRLILYAQEESCNACKTGILYTSAALLDFFPLLSDIEKVDYWWSLIPSIL
jgi:hypothetical protein